MKEPDLIAEFLNREGNGARTSLRKCCAVKAWVDCMYARIPFVDDHAVIASATEFWNRLDRASRLEAFAAHPRIGDVESLRAKFANTMSLASSEQSGVDQANEQILLRLAELNDAYFKKFSYIFIVCASGKSAEEMLDILESRLPNGPEVEFEIASQEQLKITLLRLEKLNTHE